MNAEPLAAPTLFIFVHPWQLVCQGAQSSATPVHTNKAGDPMGIKISLNVNGKAVTREVETGTLRRSGGGRWVFSYLPGTDDDEPIFRLSKHVFAPGEYVTITEHDGVERTFKVASVEDWHPGAPQAGREKASDRRAPI